MQNTDISGAGASKSTIRRRLIAAVLIGIATATLLSTVASGWREASRYADAKKSEIDATAQVFALAVADALAANNKIGILKGLRAIGKVPGFSYARVEDLNGRTLAALGNTVALAEDPDLPLLLRSSLEVATKIVKEGRPIGRLTILVKTQELRQRLIDGLLTGLLAAFLSGAIGIVIVYRLQKRITEPLRRLTRSMAEVRQTHNFSQLVEHQADDETGVLVDTFNDMMVQISKRDRRLTRHREQLEETVEKRTHDLKLAKEVAEDANAAKSDFLATMSHEIRTPMNGMLVMAELLASANLTDRHRRYADVVVKSGQSLLTIINDILDFSKIESGKLELESIPFAPAGVIDDVLALFWERANAKGLDLAGYEAPDLPENIIGDPVRLNQIISNLVNNALKFTESGHVLVTVCKRTGAHHDAGDIIEFCVADTGIGIAADKLDAVFESFSQADQSTTRRFGGTGLGLAICKRLAEAMGGKIWVTSTETEGSQFHFAFPLVAAASDALPDTEEATLFTGKALVAINGSATADVVTRFLRDLAIEVIDTGSEPVPAALAATADVIFADPAMFANLPAAAVSTTGTRRYTICLSEMGDIKSDELIDSGLADDVLMRPISHNAFFELMDRLARGAPRGRAVLERRAGNVLPSFAGVKVLVADDSPVNREVVMEALKQVDVAADLVEDGVQAVEAARKQHYDLIFMDCSMPEMDGFEATRRIRASEAETGAKPVPIVALTAHIAGTSADQWRDAGMNDYLTKPFRITDLTACFEKFDLAATSGDIPDAEQPTTVPGTLPATPSIVAMPAPAADQPPPQSDPAGDDDVVPVIDGGILQSVAACQEGSGHELVLRILSLFETHAPDALRRLEEAGGPENAKEIGDAAHALKSMCHNIGARRLADACQNLEAAANSNDLHDFAALLQNLQQEFAGVTSEVRALSQTGNDQLDRLLA